MLNELYYYLDGLCMKVSVYKVCAWHATTEFDVVISLHESNLAIK